MGRVVQRIPVDGACIPVFAGSQDGNAVFGGGGLWPEATLVRVGARLVYDRNAGIC